MQIVIWDRQAYL